jgi:hypothetical protein
MVSTIIDNDKDLLDFVLELVASNMILNLEVVMPEILKENLSMENTFNYLSTLVQSRSVNPKQLHYAKLLSLKVKVELAKSILAYFFDTINWEELAEHYKSKWTESLHLADIIDKDSVSGNQG